MKWILFAILISPLALKCQKLAMIARDTLINKQPAVILTNDSIIEEGSVLKCGRGTLPNGSFKYLHTSSTSWVAIMSASQANPEAGVIPLGKSYGGLNLHVKAIKKMGNKKRGYRYVIKVGGGDIVNYDVELEDAIAVGEVIGTNVSMQTIAAAREQASPDPVDELKRLKGLLDAGAITQQEYDSTKKKILSRM